MATVSSIARRAIAEIGSHPSPASFSSTARLRLFREPGGRPGPGIGRDIAVILCILKAERWGWSGSHREPRPGSWVDLAAQHHLGWINERVRALDGPAPCSKQAPDFSIRAGHALGGA